MVERLVSIHHDMIEDGIELEYEWLSGGVHFVTIHEDLGWANGPQWKPKQPQCKGKIPPTEIS